jgi:hypothetical protein
LLGESVSAFRRGYRKAQALREGFWRKSHGRRLISPEAGALRG